jgi:hypothetical protein
MPPSGGIFIWKSMAISYVFCGQLRRPHHRSLKIYIAITNGCAYLTSLSGHFFIGPTRRFATHLGLSLAGALP